MAFFCCWECCGRRPAPNVGRKMKGRARRGHGTGKTKTKRKTGGQDRGERVTSPQTYHSHAPPLECGRPPSRLKSSSVLYLVSSRVLICGKGLRVSGGVLCVSLSTRLASPPHTHSGALRQNRSWLLEYVSCSLRPSPRTDGSAVAWNKNSWFVTRAYKKTLTFLTLTKPQLSYLWVNRHATPVGQARIVVERPQFLQAVRVAGRVVGEGVRLKVAVE